MEFEQLVAVVVIVHREHRVLAMRRSPTKDAAPGAWETVSGRLVPGEEPLDAARRELEEETQLSVRLTERPIDAYAATRADRPMVVLAYSAQYVAGELHLSDEHDRHEWCTLKRFRSLCAFPRLVLAVERCLTSASQG